MVVSWIQRRKALLIGALLVALQVTGCTGIQPYQPRDYREEGPERGLITGAEGEFVIFRKADEPASGTNTGNASDQTAEGDQQKTDSKNNENTKNGLQQP